MVIKILDRGFYIGQESATKSKLVRSRNNSWKRGVTKIFEMGLDIQGNVSGCSSDTDHAADLL